MLQARNLVLETSSLCSSGFGETVQMLEIQISIRELVQDTALQN